MLRIWGLNSHRLANAAIPPLPAGPALAPIFANPEVVKVLHGSDSDVVWLQVWRRLLLGLAGSNAPACTMG